MKPQYAFLCDFNACESCRAKELGEDSPLVQCIRTTDPNHSRTLQEGRQPVLKHLAGNKYYELRRKGDLVYD